MACNFLAMLRLLKEVMPGGGCQCPVCVAPLLRPGHAEMEEQHVLFALLPPPEVSSRGKPTGCRGAAKT